MLEVSKNLLIYSDEFKAKNVVQYNLFIIDKINIFNYF